jgi:OmpA-OmpF porin, OOP family
MFQEQREIAMKALTKIAVAVLVSGTSSICLADSGNFFVSGDIGQANYHIDDSAPNSILNPFQNHLNNSDTAGALRFGYRWHSVVDFGVEAGYADLGQVSGSVNRQYGPPYDQLNGSYQNTLKDDGWLLGGNLKYTMDSGWYLSARGGWFRARVQNRGTSTASYTCVPAAGYLCPAIVGPLYYQSYNVSNNVNGEYVGLGAGYNVSSNISVGLSYDYYQSDRFGGGTRVNVGVASLSAEYRF